MTRARRVGVATAVAIAAPLSLAMAQMYYPKKAKAKDAAGQKTQQEAVLSAAKILEALDQLQAEQQELLQAVEQLKQEMAIIKVRASVRPSSS